jgi:hypothetical protein
MATEAKEEEIDWDAHDAEVAQNDSDAHEALKELPVPPGAHEAERACNE